MKKEKKSFPVVLLSFLIVVFISCGSNQEDKKEKLIKAQSISKSKDIEETEGEHYSDSMVKAIVDEIMRSNYPIPIDTFFDLHSFGKSKFRNKECAEFDTDLISEYSDIENPVTEPQKMILGVTDYLCNRTFSNKFDTYVFYSKSDESHFGNSIILFTIDKTSNFTNHLILSQEYFSEGYEYIIKSKFLNDKQIVVCKTELFNTSDSDKSNDSTRIVKNIFQINETGIIEKIE